MISVPDAGLLPITPRPVRFMNGSITSSGKPYGYVGNAVGVTTPISSQWPAVVSFPFERSSRRPATAGAYGCGGHPSSGLTLPSPNASRFGRSRPPTARARFPRVSDPSSPQSAASGSSPAPTASSTITQARDIGGYPSPRMDTVFSLTELILYISAILALSMAVTWAVVRVSPSESAKEQQASEKAKT